MRLPTSERLIADVTTSQTENNLSVLELSRFLKVLGKSLQRPGNSPALGEALVLLSEALRRHPKEELEDVLESLVTGVSPRERERRQIPAIFEGIELQSLETNQVKELLYNEQLSKHDLVCIGSARFGLSKSRLERQSKQAILDSVSSALHSEESYRVIGEEAIREGLRRAKV